MRARVAKALLARPAGLPAWAAMLEIHILSRATARGFGVPAPRLSWLSRERALREYADFTARCARMGDTDLPRLRRSAFDLGARVRQLAGLRDQDSLQRLVFLLYRGLGIAMRGALPGEIVMDKCYFSAVYTPGACAVMSRVDEGVIAGVMGEGRLRFARRITEG